MDPRGLRVTNNVYLFTLKTYQTTFVRFHITAIGSATGCQQMAEGQTAVNVEIVM